MCLGSANNMSYPFCLPKEQFEQEVVYHEGERKGGWREVKAASVYRIVEMITRMDYHGMKFTCVYYIILKIFMQILLLSITFC